MTTDLDKALALIDMVEWSGQNGNTYDMGDGCPWCSADASQWAPSVPGRGGIQVTPVHGEKCKAAEFRGWPRGPAGNDP